jgi:KDO2-lipid IV(A) lauroyltransferase
MRSGFVVGMLRGLAALPLPLAHGIGVQIGRVLYRLPSRSRRVAEVNLGLCYPELSDEARDRLLRETLIETGKTITELGAIWFWPPEKVLGLVKGVSGEEHYRASAALGRGVIALTPHLGQWEMMGIVGPRYRPMTSLYRPPRIAAFGAILNPARERTGNRLVPTDRSGVRAIHQALGRNEMVGILPDQDPGREAGVYAPFFGIEANTMTLVSRMAIKTGAGVVVAYAERLPRAQGFHVWALPVDPAVNEEPIERSVAAVNAAVEACVRRIPAQYQWIYKRFKTRPRGAPRFYD